MGVQISGDTGNVLATKGTYSGNLTVGGVLTYEDVTNVDSVGLVTARSGIEIGARPGVAASISVDGNMIVSGITTFTPGGSEIVRINSGGLLVYNDVSFFGASTHAYWDSSANQFALNDNTKLSLGSSSDLSIYHDGSDSYISQTGTGNLILQGNASNNIAIRAKSGEEGINLIPDGAVELYHDNSKKVETNSSGVTVTGTVTSDGLVLSDSDELQFGNSTDFRIYHDGSNSYIKDVGTGDLNISGSIVRLQSSGGETLLRGVEDGAVELYYDNVKKVSTQTWGLEVIGNIHADDNYYLILGSSNDFNIYHDGSTNIIEGQYHPIELRHGSEVHIKCVDDGAVELYYDNVKRFETKSNGVEMFGYMSVESTSGSVAQFIHSSSGDTIGIIMRHGRGGLSGYSGKMISFRGNDNTEEGSIVIGTTNTAFNTSSDYRLKENETSISNPITKLKTLKPYTFNFKKDPSVKVDGFFAHEVSSVVPVAVTGTKDQVDEDNNPVYQGIDQSKLVPLLTAALQEAVTEIESLKARLDAAGL